MINYSIYSIFIKHLQGTCSYRASPGPAFKFPTSAFSVVSHFLRNICVLRPDLDRLLCLAFYLLDFWSQYSRNKWPPNPNPISFCTTWPAPRTSASHPLSSAFASCSTIRISLTRPSSLSFQILSPRQKYCVLHLLSFFLSFFTSILLGFPFLHFYI